MCLLALYYRVLPDAPLLLAANREEFFDRPALPPQVEGSEPRVLCGTDQRAGGTWLGVNQHGLVVAVTNRRPSHPPPQPRSRGTLCREMLATPSADRAAALAQHELETGRYDGANFVCADSHSGWFVCGDQRAERTAIPPGCHLLTAGDPNDPRDARQNHLRRLLPSDASLPAGRLLDQLAKIFSQPPSGAGPADLVIHKADRGTVSSTLLAITNPTTQSIYRYAPAPPDQQAYDDYSKELRTMLQEK